MSGATGRNDGSIRDLLASSPDRLPLPRVATIALASVIVYGALAGFFDGGLQILVTALKAPLIVGFSIVLCLPSFVVFQIVAGDDARPVDLVRRIAAFAGVTSLILVALGPIAWLFSLTSRSLGFLVVLHLVTWGLALVFGLRMLRAVSGSRGARRVAVLWLALFFVVSLQVTAYLGPVLVRSDGEPLFELQRESFLTRYHRAVTEDREARR